MPSASKKALEGRLARIHSKLLFLEEHFRVTENYGAADILQDLAHEAKEALEQLDILGAPAADLECTLSDLEPTQ